MDNYSTAVINGVLRSLQTPAAFLRNTFFQIVNTFDTEEVYFDRESDDLRLAPVVSPLVAGRVVEASSYKTTFIKPAYLKPKTVIRPSDTLKRIAGERIGGEMSQQARKDALMAQRLLALETQRIRREELMAVQALRTGTVTISGEGYGTRVLDYGRAAGLTKTLSGVALWSDAASNPLKALEDWSSEAQMAELGAPITTWVMEPAAVALFKERLRVRGDTMLLDTSYRGGTSAAELGPLAGKVNYIGRFGAHEIWSYQDWYKDDAGVIQPFLASGDVIGVGAAEGTRYYGAIQDFDAMIATEVFAKTYREQDPSVEYLMLQSAPVLAPRRINATFRAKVNP
jgi:hypothetical protein